MAPLTIVRIWPPGGASCNSWKFGHLVASLALAYCSYCVGIFMSESSGVCMGPIKIKLLKISFEVWVRFTSLFNFVVFSCIAHFQCFSLDDMSGWNWHYGGWLPTTQQSEANCPIYALQIFKLLRFEKIYYRERQYTNCSSNTCPCIHQNLFHRFSTVNCQYEKYEKQIK